MAKIERKKNVKSSKRIAGSPFSIYWNSNNYIILIAGLITAIIGFYFLSVKPWDSTSALVISPIILLIAYIIIIPLSILYKKKNKESEQEIK